jgi:hypothetical protein
MFTEPSKSPWISISINLFFSKLNLLVIKESLIKVVNYSKIMKKKLLFKQRCARSSYYLAIKLSPVRA